MNSRIWRRIPALCCIFLTLLGGASRIVAATATVSNSLDLTVSAGGVLSVPPASALTQSGALFNAYSNSLTLQYLARTSATGGGGVTMQVTQDFQTGGPSVAGGDLSYTCGVAGLGTACGTTTASTAAGTQVLTLPSSACTGGGAPCSSASTNTVVLTFTLADKPGTKTGSFTATVQFTISAT